jgi:CBS domain-containing protein
MQVRDVMTTDVISVRPETPLKDVAHVLVERRISGVPVVDDDGTVLGVVSEADFVAREGAEPARQSRFAWLTGGARREEDAQRVAAVTAGEAMSRPAVTVEPDAPLYVAARKMNVTRFNRLPVVESGRLVGIITRADVVRAFDRSDEDLARAVRIAIRAVDGLRVDSVSEGVVHLAGHVAHPAIAETIPEVIRHVDGVVAVDAADVTSDPAPDVETPFVRPGEGSPSWWSGA